MAFKAFACLNLQCLARHGSQNAFTTACTATATATSPTISTASSMAGVLCSANVQWNHLDSLFVGSLWILFLLIVFAMVIRLQTNSLYCTMCWRKYNLVKFIRFTC